MVVGGKQYRYSGTVPRTMNPWAAVNLGTAMLELARMCKTIPLEAPWNGQERPTSGTASPWRSGWTPPRAVAVPPATCSRPPSPAATPAPRRRSRCCSCSTRWLGRRPGVRVRRRGRLQDSRIVGGMGAVYGPMAAEIGDSLHLSQPVRRIDQDDEGVTVRSGRHDGDRAARDRRGADRDRQPDHLRANASRRPVVSASAHAERADLQDQHRLRRAVLAADGLSGQIRRAGTPAPVTIDACTDTGTPGVLCVIVEGPTAREHVRAGRRRAPRADLAELASASGPRRVAGRLHRAELDHRTLFGRRNAQPRTAGRAHRVRPRAA